MLCAAASKEIVIIAPSPIPRHSGTASLPLPITA